MDIKPQPGPQEAFLSTPADIAVFGGSAGSGKTFGLCLEPLRHVQTNAQFGAVIFRRTLADAKKQGSLRDEMTNLYGSLGASQRFDGLEWKFKGGGQVSIGHLEHDKT